MQNHLVKNALNDPSENIWPVGLQEGEEILPQTINAFYNPADNSINILAGFVNAVYNPANESYEEMLAGVGTTIGHEISHRFDPLGSKFDKDGTYRNWWTDADHAAFEKKVDFHHIQTTEHGRKNKHVIDRRTPFIIVYFI